MKKMIFMLVSTLVITGVTAKAQTTTTQTFYGKNTGSSETIKTTGSGSSTITIRTISINCDNFYSQVCYTTTTTTAPSTERIIHVEDGNRVPVVSGRLYDFVVSDDFGGTKNEISVVVSSQ